MNKNKSAASSRRSALIERIRLREEWSALKGTEEPKAATSKPKILKRIPHTRNKKPTKNNNCGQPNFVSSDALRGVVALVEVGGESKALALRAALNALGATVMPLWGPLVTHLIWSEGGCRSTRAKARALASQLVSPLWVEACASANQRLPERAFPAVARPSDLPSPVTLRRMLKRAEMENIPLVNLLCGSGDDSKEEHPKLRLSSETELDTSADTSKDKSTDKSAETSREDIDVATRVNTAPRRIPHSPSVQPAKSKRKLFTYKEGVDLGRTTDEESDDEPKPKSKPARAVTLTQRERKDLARAERMARRIMGVSTPKKLTQVQIKRPRIVLSGMSRTERAIVIEAIKSLNGKIQNKVNKNTTHVLLGSCRDDKTTRDKNNFHMLPNGMLPQVLEENFNISGVTSLSRSTTKSSALIHDKENINDNNLTNLIINTENVDVIKDSASISKKKIVIPQCDTIKARTLNTLLGAARGCRVLYAQWAVDSMIEKKWLHHYCYEVQHLRKIAQKARVERSALMCMHSEYAYDVFCGMRVRIMPNTEQKESATELLTLCGAAVRPQDGGTHNITRQDGGTINRTRQDGGPRNCLTLDGSVQTADCDLTLGVDENEVSSKWVFDSVAAARMRTVRRYINHRNMVSQLTDC